MVRVVGTEEPFIGSSSGESLNWFAHTCAFVLVGVAVLLVPLASQSLIARLAGVVTLVVLLRFFLRLSRPRVNGAQQRELDPPPVVTRSAK